MSNTPKFLIIYSFVSVSNDFLVEKENLLICICQLLYKKTFANTKYKNNSLFQVITTSEIDILDLFTILDLFAPWCRLNLYLILISDEFCKRKKSIYHRSLLSGFFLFCFCFEILQDFEHSHSLAQIGKRVVWFFSKFNSSTTSVIAWAWAFVFILFYFQLKLVLALNLFCTRLANAYLYWEMNIWSRS